MKKLIALSTLACFGCLTLAEGASAQVVVQPGTEFPAAPISKNGFSFTAPSQPMAAAPPPAPVVAPAPEPAPRKRRKRRKSS